MKSTVLIEILSLNVAKFQSASSEIFALNYLDVFLLLFKESSSSSLNIQTLLQNACCEMLWGEWRVVKQIHTSGPSRAVQRSVSVLGETGFVHRDSAI